MTRALRLRLHLMAACIGIVLSVVAVKVVYGHGPAEWIQRGEYKNPAGELCCGERDCGYKVGGTIEEKTGGYAVDATFMVTPVGGAHFTIHLKEFVPFSEATPSPTGEFWFCKWGGKRKCFFAPGGSS